MLETVTHLYTALRCLGVVLGLGSVTLATLPAYSGLVSQVEFLGQATLNTRKPYKKTEVGGLSGITYDAKQKLYYSLSDDRSQKAPARFYTLKIDLESGKLKPNGVKLTGVTPLLDRNRQMFPPLSLDPEGIALTNSGSLWISSEGDADKLINPFVQGFSLSGQLQAGLPVDRKYFPTADKSRGIRQNQAFESLTLTPDNQYLFVGIENALIQDGPAASLQAGSPSRILRYNLATRQVDGEFVYQTEAIVAPAEKISTAAINGLVDLLALDNQGRMLSLERMFVPDLGFTIRLFEISLQDATNVQGQESLSRSTGTQIKPVQKRLLADLRTLKIPLDNLEGMTLGPRLSDGRQSLIIVSDNNFSPFQVTQFLAFGLRMGSSK
jgi:hypothetical protein